VFDVLCLLFEYMCMRLLPFISWSIAGVPLSKELPGYLITALKVPGLPIRDCAERCKSSVQMCTMVSATDVTAKTFFERLYLVLGLRKIAL